MTLLKKLAITSAGTAVVGFTVAWLGFWQVQRIAAEAKQVIQGPADKMDRYGALNLEFSTLRVAARNILVYALTDQKEILKEQISRFEASRTKCAAKIADLKTRAESQEERQQLEVLSSNHDKWISVTVEVEDMCNRGLAREAAVKSAKEARGAALTMDAARDKLWNLQRINLHAASAQMEAARAKAGWIALGGVSLTVAAALLALLALRSFRKQLGKAVQDLALHADQMAGSATQITSASQALANTASPQSAAVQEASSSAEQVTKFSLESSRKASDTAEQVASVDKLIREGNQTVTTMRSTMEELRSSGARISEVIRVIEEIAFQTNILALNAAIEAAHAGNDGLGFAVVANEVRTLAQRSAEAARNTEELVTDSLNKSLSGSECARQVDAVFRQIEDKTRQLLSLTEHVRSGNAAQSEYIGSIASRVSDLNGGIHNTAAAAEEGASASAQMSHQAQSVEQIAAHLAEMIGV